MTNTGPVKYEQEMPDVLKAMVDVHVATNNLIAFKSGVASLGMTMSMQLFEQALPSTVHFCLAGLPRPSGTG